MRAGLEKRGTGMTQAPNLFRSKLPSFDKRVILRFFFKLKIAILYHIMTKAKSSQLCGAVNTIPVYPNEPQWF